MVFRVMVLGSRGSASVEGSSFSVYGGATSCTYVEAGGKYLVLDGGSGIMTLPYVMGSGKEIHLMLSHMHIDHISGMFVCPSFFDPGNTVNIYIEKKDGMGAQERFLEVMREPIWPVGPEMFTAKVNFIDRDTEFSIGDVKIATMQGSHPGGVVCYKIECDGKSLVYMTDCEITKDNIFSFATFAKGCTLLLCDGQYKHDEMHNRRGFGHSSWEQVAELAYMCGSPEIGIIHHDPIRTDMELYNMNALLQKVYPRGFFARMNEERYL